MNYTSWNHVSCRKAILDLLDGSHGSTRKVPEMEWFVEIMWKSWSKIWTMSFLNSCKWNQPPRIKMQPKRNLKKMICLLKMLSFFRFSFWFSGENMFSSTPSKQTSIIYQQTKLTKSPTRWRLIFTQLEKHAQVKLDHLCKGWGQKNKDIKNLWNYHLLLLMQEILKRNVHHLR